MRTELGLSYTAIGVLLSLPAAGALVGNLFAAAADHRSRRVIAAGGAVGLAVAMALFALGTSFWVLAAAAFMYGAAATAMVDGAEVAMVDAVPDGGLRRTLARSNLFGALGDLTGPLLFAGVVAVGVGWRGSFGLMAALLLVFAWWLGVSPLPRPRPAAPPSGSAEGVAGGEETRRRSGLWRDHRVWRLGLIALLTGPLDESLLGFLLAFLQEVRGLSASGATLVGGGFVVGGLAAFTVVVHRLQDRSDRAVLAGSALAMGAAVVIVILVSSPAVVVGAGLVFGVGLSCAWLVEQHQSLTLVPGRSGTVGAVVSTIEMGGFAIPPLIGAVADRYGLTAGLLAYALLPVAIVVLAAHLPAGRHDEAPAPASDAEDARLGS